MASQHLKLKPFALNPLAAVFEPMGDVAFERELPATEVIEGSAAPIDTLCVRSEPLTEFHPFPRLPSEIRLKIWKLGVPGDGRIVELKYSKKIFHAVSPTPAPVLMHVSREVSLSLNDTRWCYKALKASSSSCGKAETDTAYRPAPRPASITRSCTILTT
jgi:hypothetical protein